MKAFRYLSIFVCSFFVQQALAQYPVSFPDGIVVGNSAVSIPTGSAYKLAVSGGIITEKVRIATNGTAFWADYVFDPSFRLKPLAEVERFIKENKHLPDVPSTCEVSENGIDLAQNQAILLQKLEELTLYVIEQQKQILRLSKKLKAVQKKK